MPTETPAGREPRERQEESNTEKPDSQWPHLTGNQRDVLVAVTRVHGDGENAAGHEVADAYDGPIIDKTVYNNLAKLVEFGFVNKHVGVPNDRTNSYALTATGMRLLKQRIEAMNNVADSLPESVDGVEIEGDEES